MFLQVRNHAFFGLFLLSYLNNNLTLRLQEELQQYRYIISITSITSITSVTRAAANVYSLNDQLHATLVFVVISQNEVAATFTVKCA